MEVEDGVRRDGSEITNHSCLEFVSGCFVTRHRDGCFIYFFFKEAKKIEYKNEVKTKGLTRKRKKKKKKKQMKTCIAHGRKKSHSKVAEKNVTQK